MKDAINWFEIPVKDFARAKEFYKAVTGKGIEDHHMPEQNMEYGVFEYDMENQRVGGAICKMEGFNPSTDGVTVYLNGGDDLSAPLSRVEAAGGKVIMQKTSIGENGFMAQFIDTEGNRIALHSMN